MTSHNITKLATVCPSMSNKEFLTWALKHHEEVQTKDANGRVVLNPQVDVLLDAKAKIAIL